MAEHFNTGNALVKGMTEPGSDGETGYARIGWLLGVLTSFLVVALIAVSLLSLVV